MTAPVIPVRIPQELLDRMPPAGHRYEENRGAWIVQAIREKLEREKDG